MADRFRKQPVNGRYSLAAASMNMREITKSMDCDARRNALASIVVVMPILGNTWEAVTRVLLSNSNLMVMDSTFKSLWSDPLRHSSLWLLVLMSWIFSIHPWILSEVTVFLPLYLYSVRSTVGLVPAAGRSDAGATYSTASPILRSAVRRPVPMDMVEVKVPISSDIKWENAFSTKAQSTIMVVVRSIRSLFPRKERGRVLSYPTKRIRVWALSL